MLREAGVVPRQNQLPASVTKSRTTLAELQTASGRRVSAKVFIDATSEGDLMALAGVSFTVGRDSSTIHGESLAGTGLIEILRPQPFAQHTAALPCTAVAELSLVWPFRLQMNQSRHLFSLGVANLLP
jgi:hypothetical protein